MYSNQTLYYLNQIGVRPWIKRESTLSLTTDSLDALKLIIFISAHLSGRARSLLKQMLIYLNVPEQELTIISVSEQEVDNALLYQRPQAVLLLGVEPKTSLNFNCPVLTSMAPDYLITHPAEKKSAFKDLCRLKQLLT